MMKYISNKVTKALGLIALTGLSGLMNAQTMDWSPAGPIYNAGRSRNLVVDAGDPTGKIIYTGSASSGVFKTIDGGANWSPLDDQGTVKNISYMAQGQDGTIYASTGEGYLRPGQKLKAQKGTGLYKLTGNTLTLVSDSSVVGNIINRIACSPVNAQIIAIASNKGILISTNGGASFTPAPGITSTVNVTFGLDVKFDNLGNLYCSIGNERGIVFGVNFSTISSKVWRSADPTLSSFTNITPTSSILSDSNYGRIELAIAPSNNQVIYASCARKSNNLPNGASLQGLFVSYDGGANWGLILQGSPQLDPLGNGGTIASGDYAHVIVVSPNNPDQLFYGGYSFYLFQKTGGSNSSPVGNWTPLGNHLTVNTPYYLHENIHDIKIVNGSPVKFYFVTDAGIYRSADLANSNGMISPSFQPFYKGLVTGQFNSVSIERYPLTNLSVLSGTPPAGTPVVPYSGFIGGTGGNGVNYFSGTGQVVNQEINYLTGEVYNAELSKILSGAAIMSTANGNLYRSTNVKTSDPTLVNFNSYTGPLSRIAPATTGFNVGDVTAGTPFKLWENYKNTVNGPDAAVFYNDSLRAQASMIGLETLTTQATFTFSTARPNRSAQIDSIVIRTGTVTLPVTGNSASVATAFSGTDKKDIAIKISNSYIPPTNTLSVPPVSIFGPAASVAGVTLNPVTNLDDISITFTSAPFANKTIPFYPTNATGTNIVVPDPAAYYRVFATVFYKYKPNDTISIADNNISTINKTYTATLTQSLSWAYGNTTTAYTITANTPTTVSSPTYVLNPGNVTQSSPSFTVHPVLTTTYVISTLGNYSISATPVIYTISATPSLALPGPTYTFVLTPGNASQTAVSTASADIIFSVSPVANTNYTITQYGSSTVTSTTFSTVNTSTYVLNPGNVTQSSPDFTVQVTAPTTYTIDGVSSNTVLGANTTKTFTLPVQTTSVAGNASVPFAANNPIVKIPTKLSARLAVVFNNAAVTGSGGWAVVVSKSPLDLNDPLNFVRLSQDGCLTTKPDGTPETTITGTTSVVGRPTILEWSKSGRELYYATDAKKLYRVSYIDLIMDFSPGSYSGKLSTDVFQYSSSASGGLTTIPNLNSPYRTTLIGTFTNQITSISVDADDAGLLVTLDGGNLVAYTNNNISMSNATNINFQQKLGTGMTNTKTYCSLIEMIDKHKVFIGTDNGIYATNDITASAPVWANINNNQLPNVQVFDLKQQTLPHYECYNSRQIYAATNGRGVWINSSLRGANDMTYVGIDEKERAKTEKNISIFPNPTNGDAYITFNSVQGENAIVNLMDINGRVVKTETLGKLDSGEVNYTMETASLSSGIYIVSIHSSEGIKRVAKLIVTK